MQRDPPQLRLVQELLLAQILREPQVCMQSGGDPGQLDFGQLVAVAVDQVLADQVPALSVGFTDAPQVLVLQARLNEFGVGQLFHGSAAQVEGLPDNLELPGDCLGSGQPAHPQPGSEGLAGRAAVDDPLR